MSNSNHRIICTDCGRDQPVVEDAISNPAIKPPEPTSATPKSASTARAYFHATRENDACTERGSMNSIDVVCRGSPICGIHNRADSTIRIRSVPVTTSGWAASPMARKQQPPQTAPNLPPEKAYTALNGRTGKTETV